MNREVKLSLLSIAGLVFVFATIILLSSEYSAYAILTATVAVILVAYAVIYYHDTKDHYSLYKTKLRKVINTYDSILVKSEKLPDMVDHSIIMVASMEDLVYAQMVIKKPIYFYEEERSCSFVLIDDKEICVYILKSNHEDVTATGIIIDEIRRQPEKKKDFDHSILDDIENTTIIKLDNHKTYKVSPVRKKEKGEEPVKEYVKDITQILDVVGYKNAEIKEDLFIALEPKKKKKKNDQNVNLTEVEEEIDSLVELSNTKVLDVIEKEPIDTESVKRVQEKKDEEKQENESKPKQKPRNNRNRRNNNRKKATNRK